MQKLIKSFTARSIKSHLNLLFYIIISTPVYSYAQSLATGQEVRYNPITTAVPFLTITPDSRHGAMGEVGVATSPDANSQNLNPSKYAFIEGKYGFSVSYTPWLRELVRDNNLNYLAGFYRIDNNQVIGSSMRYFSMGDIILMSQDKVVLGTVRPNEYAIDFSYSRKLSDRISGGVTMRYIRSDINGGIGTENYMAGNALAADVSFYYIKKWGNKEGGKSIAYGINLSNIGSKISYDLGSNKEYLPANIRLGSTFTTELNVFNSVSFSLDFNKLLVPTPSSRLLTGSDDNVVILPVYDANKPVTSSIFASFTDAPGGFKEELQEIMISTGLEYWYDKKFALRTGYFHESQNKGNRNFFSAGVGVKMNKIAIDFSYVIPSQRNNALSNTIRFTLSFDFDSFVKNQETKNY